LPQRPIGGHQRCAGGIGPQLLLAQDKDVAAAAREFEEAEYRGSQRLGGGGPLERRQAPFDAAAGRAEPILHGNQELPGRSAARFCEQFQRDVAVGAQIEHRPQ